MYTDGTKFSVDPDVLTEHGPKIADAAATLKTNHSAIYATLDELSNDTNAWSGVAAQDFYNELVSFKKEISDVIDELEKVGDAFSAIGTSALDL